MITVSKFYNYIFGILLVCGLFAFAGYHIAIDGGFIFLGWLVGMVGVVTGNILVIASLIVSWFGKKIKFVRKFINFNK